MTQPRVGAATLREMIAAGPRGVSRYTGTLFAVFIAQTLIALAAMVAM